MRCKTCGKDILNNDEIALNKKFCGKMVVDFFCINCLANFYNCSVELLNEKIIQFKADGCVLFFDNIS